MRTIESHKANPANDKLVIEVLDEPGSGGAYHHYEISGFSTKSNQSLRNDDDVQTKVTLVFQNGPINEVGVNGVTHEALLAILIDRLECFQAGKFANEYNDIALDHLRTAKDTLHRRTKERMARGVEGTHQL